MAATFDAATSFTDGDTSISFTHTPVGTPTLAILMYHYDVLSGPSAAPTYGGQAMTLAAQALGATTFAAIYYKANPLSGAQTVAMTQPFASATVGGALTFTKTTGVPDNGTGTYEADGDVTLTVSNTTAFDLVVQVAGNTVDSNHAPQSGQTEIWDQEHSTSTLWGAGYRMTAGAGSTALRVTASSNLATAACRIYGIKDQAAAGTLTSSGAISKTTKKALAGTLTSAGTAAKKMFLSLAGALTLAGANFQNALRHPADNIPRALVSNRIAITRDLTEKFQQVSLYGTGSLLKKADGDYLIKADNDNIELRGDFTASVAQAIVNNRIAKAEID